MENNLRKYTNQFIEGYKYAFEQLNNYFGLQSRKKKNLSHIHNVSLQILSQIMFNYFLQSEGYIGKATGTSNNNGFNFLNNHLFSSSIHDELNTTMMNLAILDDLIVEITENFFDHYNFTIHENFQLNLQQDVTINPEMLGKVYELLITEEEQIKSGVFYTPQSEVDLMVRLALTQFLEKTCSISLKALITFVFNPNSANNINNQGSESISNALSRCRVIDPACGSGAFLVSMAEILLTLQCSLRGLQGKTKKFRYQIKNQILRDNIYGIDIKTWAITNTKLRLWLWLLIDAPQIDRAENNAKFPKLVNLRVGDSLVFQWETEFVDVFINNGFDIVIGNPPFIRSENIKPPLKRKISKKDITYYKDTILAQMIKYWGNVSIPRQSDYFVYFYYVSLHILNRKGTLTFITSNSWLDVKYGAKLQYFLLNQTKIHYLIENQSKRIFDAGINTIITVCSINKDYDDTHTHQTIFITLFNDIKHGREEIYCQKMEIETNVFRVRIRTVHELLRLGATQSNTNIEKYQGYKWSSILLRAPALYFKILEKIDLVQLGNVIDIKRGFTTGANHFFYLTEDQINKWKIERKYLKSLIKSPKESKKISIVEDLLKFKVLLVNKEKKELIKTNVLRYIEYGEREQLQEKPTLKSRKNWYELGIVRPSFGFWPYITYERFLTFKNPGLLYADCQLFNLYVKSDANNSDVILAILNSTIMVLFTELHGRVNLGEGALKTQVYEVEKIPFPKLDIIKPSLESSIIKTFNKLANRNIGTIFEELGTKNPEMFSIENVKPDRRELDYLILKKIFRLSDNEIIDLYKSVLKIVSLRTKKAKSRALMN